MDLFVLSASLGLDITNFSSSISLAKNMLINLGEAITNFSKDVVKTGMGFDKQMSAVQAVLGATEGTVENMELLRSFALDTAEDSVFTSEEVAKAYYYMGMAGWKTEQQLAGLPGVIALAAASGEDLSMVSDIVTDSITAFGLSADDVSHYVDILAQTATNTNTDVKRMGQTFKYVAPIAGQLGADVDDVALSIGLMASAGIKGTMAGTALRNIFTRISTNAGATSKTLGALDIITNKLGVSFYDANGEMRDWGDILVDTRSAWKGLTSEEAIYYAKQIASMRGMSGWLAIMNASEEDFQKVRNSLDDAAGAAQLMADTRLDNLWGDVTRFNAALDVLKIAIYDDVKGPMRDITQYGTQSLQRITNAVNERGLTGGIEQLGVEIESLSTLVSPILESIGAALTPIVSTLINTLLPTILPAAYELGRAFFGGIISGIVSATSESSSPIMRWLSNYFSDALDQGYLGFGDVILESELEAKSKVKQFEYDLSTPQGRAYLFERNGGNGSASNVGGGRNTSGVDGNNRTQADISPEGEDAIAQATKDGIESAHITAVLDSSAAYQMLKQQQRQTSYAYKGGINRKVEVAMP